MSKTTLHTGNFLKVFKKIQCFLFLLITLTIQVSSLGASTTYTTSILDDKENASLFFDAIKLEDFNAVKSLIDSGCDVNERNHNGYTPLMAAVYKGNIEIVKLLISAKADLEGYDNNGSTPFMYAFYGNKEKKEMVTFLLALGVDAEIMNNQEKTPLILATLNNHCNSIKLLIAAGTNIETKGKLGRTALLHAAENQNIEPAKLLIEHGANLEARDDWSFTPLMLAAFQNDGPMIKIFIKAGANIHAQTTKVIPINLKKDFYDFFPTRVSIPVGSTALDIAKQFQKYAAENILQKV
jgi:ankyrin repeat protein